MGPGYADILNPHALAFLTALHKNFEKTRQQLLAARVARQAELDKGAIPNFLESTQHVRNGNWKGPSIPRDLSDRRVEITGPVDRKMIINALNSGAKVFMADMEDSTAPTWANVIEGQINLRDAVNRTISLKQGAKEYKLLEEKKLATLMFRPRGWHLDEAHLTVDGQALSASLVDFGLFFFHNAKPLVARGSAPYFYLPKLESHLEARLWNDVFVFAQKALNIPVGTIRATVLIETILAAFEMDEIIYELRDHSAGLNCGRWDYIFSFIKKFRAHADKTLPDRAQVTMTSPWMAAYVRLLIQTCHKRGVHAMGGMAAQIPIRGDEKANAAAFEKVRNDKLREVKAGCDGTWVAHPGLIPVAMAVFNDFVKTPNQITSNPGDRSEIKASDLMELGPKGTITEEGLKTNVVIGIDYLASWLRGTGCVPIHNLMEDAATAEISRCQIWQWVRHGATLNDGRRIEPSLVRKHLEAYRQEMRTKLKDQTLSSFLKATDLYEKMILGDKLADFLTSVAYPHIVSVGSRSKL